MKFRCNKNSILNEISTAQGIISSRNNLSILSNVLLEAGNGSLCIKATDLKIGFETVIPVDVEEPGSTTVFCDKLLGVLRTFPEGDVIFTLEGDNFIIDSEYEDSNVKLGNPLYHFVCRLLYEGMWKISERICHTMTFSETYVMQ